MGERQFLKISGDLTSRRDVKIQEGATLMDAMPCHTKIHIKLIQRLSANKSLKNVERIKYHIFIALPFYVDIVLWNNTKIISSACPVFLS